MCNRMNAEQYKSLIHQLDCVACFLLLGKRVKPVQSHHPEVCRDDLSEFTLVPLCYNCHSLLHQMRRRGWERMTKLTPIDLLAGTIRLLMENEE
jgi:hypothetical protein